jgi:localization factor PodJL
MNSRVSWSVDGIDPSVRERAEAAARRAGMSLNDWLNSTVGDSAPPNFRNPEPRQFSPNREVADIHQRLDSITRQIDQISKPMPRGEASREQGVARQLNDAISRLDARLSQISNPQAARASQERQQRQAESVERAAGQVYSGHAPQGYAQAAQAAPAYRPSPPLSPASFDSAIAEIAARQSELDAPPPRPMPSRQAPPIAPMMAPPAPPPGPDFSALERHLFKITSQIEALQRPDHLEQSIAAFRGELAEIRAAITEAMPRRAIESLEGEIRSLSRRIDDNRQSAIDGNALSSVERALAEIREVLRSLMPAEQLAGYDQAIRNLGAKLDMILRANDDPGTVQQLESAISALRAIVSNVASNDALARLSDDVHMLSAKVDQLIHAGHNNDSFAALESRIAGLTHALESRPAPVIPDNSEAIEGALRSLSDRIDRMQVGNDGPSAFAHLEQRVSYLLERLEASNDHRSSNINLSRVEDALSDILRHLEGQHAAFASLADNRQQPMPMPEPRDDAALVDLLKRELSDIRYSQSETNRHTQDSLEAVNSSLGHVVDRLAMIEGDLREVRTAPAPAPAMAQSSPAPAYEPAPVFERAPAFEPEPAPAFERAPAFEPEPAPALERAPAFEPEPASAFEPEPAPAEPEAPRFSMPPQARPELPNPAAAEASRFAAEAPHFAAAPREFHAAEPVPPVAPVAPTPPRAISEILVPSSAPRPAFDPALPPDHPLEPGTRPNSRLSSPSERIAASESAISDIKSKPNEPVSSSSFIAAARRAAQAAAAQQQEGKGRGAKADKAKGDKGSSNITSKIRSLLVGASVVVIVLGTFKMAMTLLDTGTPPPMPAMENPGEAPASTLSPADSAATPAAPEPSAPAPSMTSPSPIGKQSLNRAAPADPAASVAIPQATATAPPTLILDSDITSAIPGGRKGATAQVPQGENLPDLISGPKLRAAALKGDPAAAFEVGLRYAEGKGVPQNLDEAAKWFDRAAQAGIIPATFRLGTFYEKGLGVKKDTDLARRYYTQAAERGNAKAMHNLAVLDADGGGKGANYNSAAQWFRKAADRGVADSQFNLGILYARGIGVEQNLAESFKWFSLAAAQGDADAAGKRDDIAKRLDAQSLAAAKLAIQTFTAEPQPDDAINVASPAGGWDSAPAQAAAPKPAKPAKRSASAAR